MSAAKRSLVSQTGYDLASLQAALLAWFAEQGRDLPWRRTRDPYRILVSEIMLQQTQVSRVLPKYEAFLERFPTIEALVQAPVAEVIRAWAGLGYNRRAVNLQRAARAVLDDHAGTFPRSVEELRRLPGIGPYTAGAVACFAFEQDVAFLDTNIRRVVRRVFAAPQSEPGDAELTRLANEAIPPGQGWLWNQALMELGALLCTAAAPICWRCPLRAFCRDYQARLETDQQALVGYPAPAASRPPRRIAERREEPFAGSNRWFRGRVIDALRDLPPGEALTLERLGTRIKPDFSADELPWLQTLVEGLARDGLLSYGEDAVRLPE